LAKICEETIHFAYEEVGEKIERYFKSALKVISQNHEAEKLMNKLELDEVGEEN